MSKEDWQKNQIPALFPELPDGESVLDVGCGLSLKSKYVPAQIRVGIDIYPAYFKHIESEVPYVVMKCDVTKLDEIFIPKSFDIVMAFDILEHLPKIEALSLIKKCEVIARKAVIFETPEGFVPQDIDILGLGGDEYQTHRSSWGKEELEQMGYTVKVRSYRMDDVKRHSTVVVDRDIKLLDAIKLL